MSGKLVSGQRDSDQIVVKVRTGNLISVKVFAGLIVSVVNNDPIISSMKIAFYKSCK